MILHRTIYSHGTEFCSCAYCNKLLTEDQPGLRTMSVINGKRMVEHVCKSCFDGADYQELIREHANKYGIDIRSFPSEKD